MQFRTRRSRLEAKHCAAMWCLRSAGDMQRVRLRLRGSRTLAGRLEISATAVRLLGRSARFPTQLKDAELGDGQHRDDPCGHCYRIEHFFLLLRPLRSQTATTRIWYAFYPFKQSGLHTRRLGESLMLSQTLLSVHRSVLFFTPYLLHSVQSRVLERSVTNTCYLRRSWTDLFPRLSRNCAPVGLVRNRI